MVYLYKGKEAMFYYYVDSINNFVISKASVVLGVECNTEETT